MRGTGLIRFNSGAAHQRESANIIYAMKKREISDKGRKFTG